MRVWMVLLLLPLAGCVDEAPLEDPDDPVDETVQKPALAFRAPVDLGSKAQPGAFGTSCQDSLDDGDCGLGEPSVEVDGAGTIYVSGVCCLTVAPPVYVSRDGGETFEELTTPGGVRERFGIEGDFAIDAHGRVYFADIEFAGTFQVTVWEADGTFVRHTKWPAPPLVDRDWIRAEGDGHAYYVYNTGTSTRVYKSTDAAATWSADAIYVAPYALGNAAIWPEKELCIAARDGRLDCSPDGGATWYQDQAPLDSGGANAVPVYDEAGNLYYVGFVGDRVGYAWRDRESKTWSDPIAIGPEGTHRMPWAAAGADGALSIAWYGTNSSSGGGDWHVWAAASRNATSDAPRWDWTLADPDPVFRGALGRDLLDFLQIDMGPDGALHIAYSDQFPAIGPDGNEEQLRYVRSEPSPLAMQTFWLGP